MIAVERSLSLQAPAPSIHQLHLWELIRFKQEDKTHSLPSLDPIVCISFWVFLLNVSRKS